MMLRRPARSPKSPALLLAKTALAALMAMALTATSEASTNAADYPLANSMEGNFLAGRFAAQQSDYAISADYFSEALLFDPSDPILLERALSLYLAAGDMTDVRDYATRLSDVDHNNPLAAMTIGVDDLRRGRWSASIDELDGARSGPLFTLVSEVLSAWADVGAGHPSKAIDRLTHLEGDQLLDYYRKYHCGLIASVTGNDKAAVDWFRQAMAIDDSSVLLIDATARAMARAGDREGARALLDKALAKAPDHALLAALKTALDDPRRPAPHVRKVRQGAAEILSGLGTAILREDAHDMGVILLRLSLTLDPGADLARVTLASALERNKRYEEAIDILRKVPPTSPIRRNARIMIAFDDNALDRLDAAKEELTATLGPSGKDLEVLSALGDIMRINKKFSEAAGYYDKAVALLGSTPTEADWQLFYYRGVAKERSGKWPEAEADFTKALELKPDQRLVLNYLGYSWVDRGLHLDQAMEMIRKAVASDPTDGFVIDSLGWAYFKLGDYPKAVAELEKAVELQPNDVTINDHLGDAYWRAGRRIEARFQWNHAKAGKPDPEDLARIDGKLENGLADAPPADAAASVSTTTPTTGNVSQP